MNTMIEPPDGRHHEFLVLHVRYLGSHRPFIDDGASRNETLAELKPRVLDFFKLAESDGKTYSFVLHHDPLTDMSKSLGQLAEGRHELKLKLVEQFEQGGPCPPN